MMSDKNYNNDYMTDKHLVYAHNQLIFEKLKICT